MRESEVEKQIWLQGDLPQQFEAAFQALSPRLGLLLTPAGLPVKVECRPGGIRIARTADGFLLQYEKNVQFYRGLSLLSQHWNEQNVSICQTPCFETLGMMLDVSRNAVLKTESLKGIFEKMALMGIDLGMMYTEDTYEIPQQPYFGWMRGRYSMEEFRELDDYADLFGIELCPCIQTLGHLNRALHWPALAHLKDNEEVLLADQEETYQFLRQAIAAATAPYRSKRIHIGMDEAHGIGLGAHLRRFGYEDPHAIIQRHLAKVREITRELGLQVMMWSDMYFRPDSPTGGYYDSGEPSAEVIARVPENITLVYWDYYHQRKEEYARMLHKHRLLGAPMAYAGGIWTWAGPAVDYDKTLQTAVPGLQAAKEAGVPLVLAAAWGDNGAEANLQTALLGMQLFAEFDYTGEYCPEQLSQRFRVCCGGDMQAFLGLSRFNAVPGMRSGSLRPANAAKFLLYQDPLVQLYEGDTQGLEMADHYRQLQREYQEYACREDEYQQLFAFYAQLAEVLAGKCSWHQKIGTAVRTGDKKAAAALVRQLEDTGVQLERLRLQWRNLWNSTNKSFGFEILDGRMGALRARLETACASVKDWTEGGCAPLELLEPPLPYTRMADGALFGSYAVGEIVSACKIDI